MMRWWDCLIVEGEIDMWGLIAVPADGVKGKTWGPSTCHQRERGQIPLRPQLAPRPGGIWSKSAPNLDKSRTALTRPTHEIGNIPDANPDSSHNNSVTQLFNNKSESNLSNAVSTLQLLKSKVTAIGLNKIAALGINDPKHSRFNTQRNNSYPNNGNALSNHRDTLTKQKRLSRSIGNISESHYDTVYASDSFVIARGITSNSTFHLNTQMLDLSDHDTEKLLNK